MARAKELIGSVSREKPSFSIDAKTLPAIKNWNIDKKYKIELTVTLTSLAKNEWDDEDGVLRARFKIDKAKECDDE